MHEKLYKIRKDNPDFDKKLVDMFAKNMPKLLEVLMDGETFNKHIGSKEVAKLAEPYIKNNKGDYIGFKWDYDTLISTAKSYVDFDNVDFYECDLWVWANVKYGDMQHIITDTSIIIKYAISELTDEDYPFYAAGQRAYCWLKKHVEMEV